MSVREHHGKAPGRKAGRLQIRIAEGEVGYLEMRVDTERGLFIAIDGRSWFSSESKDELQRHMAERARAARVVTWTRYIEIDYECDSPGAFGDRREIRGKIEANEDGLLDQVGGVRLDWAVVDYSDPISVPGWDTPRRKRRAVWDNGETGHEDWHRGTGTGDLPKDTILYSEAAHEALKRLRHGLGRVHLVLAGLLSGAPEEVAAKLADPGAKLLGPGGGR